MRIHLYTRISRIRIFPSTRFYSFFLPALVISIIPLALNAQTEPQGFFLDSWLPKSIAVASFDTLAQTTEPATVSVLIDADSTLTRVSKYVFGHNAAAWGGKLEQSASLVNHVTALAPQIIRWPGGNLSSEYFWSASSKATCPKDLPPTFPYADLLYGSNKTNWTMPVSSYYDLLSKTKSTGIICVNYSYARYGTGADPVAVAAKYAADWVRYDAGRTRYWELGNENFGDWESGYTIDTQYNKDGQPKTISGSLYGKHCKVFIEEMRKAAREVGNDIKIGVVAMDSYVTYNTVMRDWNKGMMQEIAGLADFVIVHSYYTPYNQNSTLSTILNSAANTKNYKQYVTDGLKTFANHEPLPVALTEYNIFAVGSGQAVSYVNGMHAALVLGELIKTGYAQGCRWDFMNGWDNGNSHGLFADGETGIARYTPRAPFFYMYYFQKFFGDRMVHSSITGSPDVISYASRFSSGESGVVLVNKGSQDQVAQINVKDFKPGSRYYYYQLTGGTDNGNFSRKVFVNNITTADDGGGPALYTELEPFGTDITGNILLKLPKLSAVYVVIEDDSTLEEQTITLDSIAPKSFGDEDFILSASASSGLPVQFASSNSDVALVTNGMVRIIGAGNCELIASQNGDTTYQPALPVSRSFTVSKVNQSISMEATDTVAFGTSDYSGNGMSDAGLPLKYSSSNTAVASIVNNQIHLKGVGMTEITATQSGNQNYNPASAVMQVLTVVKGEQTILFPAITEKTTLDPSFSPAASSSSGLACSYTSSNEDVAVVAGYSIQIVGAGTTGITAFQEGNSLYMPAAPVSRELVVSFEAASPEHSGGDKLILFPNPAQDYIILHSLTGNSTIKLYNALGMEIASYACKSMEFKLSTVGIGGNGLYFIRVNSEVLPFQLNR